MRFSEFRSFSRQGDALLVVPPFAGLERPALGPHLLQACARQVGFRVSVLYANLLLAAEIGERSYFTLCYKSPRELLGERFFAASVYGLPPFAGQGIQDDLPFPRPPTDCTHAIDRLELDGLARRVPQWLENLVTAILSLDFAVIGCSTSFQQTAASVGLLQRIKRSRPQMLTILGGANCEGEMAEGILSLNCGVDFVFSGESEVTFVEFLRGVHSRRLPARPIIRGEPCRDLNLLPTPDFAEYYEQRERWLPEAVLTRGEDVWLPYESSRGCWWGQKHHCTFCGLNDEVIAFRAKSSDRVLAELRHLMKTHPSNRVSAVDYIMPHSYLRDLIPRLRQEVPGLHMFYMQKANLSLANVVALKGAGVAVIQPGIEALSTSLLRRMDKGVSAPQNLALLRYARSAGLSLNWNLLYGFPGDELSEYIQTLELLPLLHHLHPPVGLSPLVIDRFSPYFTEPARYGLSDIRPWASYRSLLPGHADATKLAYHFDARYRSASLENPGVMCRIHDAVEAWRASWEGGGATPVLEASRLTDDRFLLLDTRGLPDTRDIQFITRDQAALVLAGRARGRTGPVEWALERRFVVELDASIVPLATADAALIDEFESETRRPGKVSSLPVLPSTTACSQGNPERQSQHGTPPFG